MPDRTYVRPVKTTSMTISERRKLKQRQKLIDKGIAPPEEPEDRRPLREGLRHKRYSYPKGLAPEIVGPRKPGQEEPPQILIPVPRLPGQEDIPGSDSPVDEDLVMSFPAVGPVGYVTSVAGPSGHAPPAANPVVYSLPIVGQGTGGSTDHANDLDETRSQASTVIEDGEDNSSESDEEGDENENHMETEGVSTVGGAGSHDNGLAPTEGSHQIANVTPPEQIITGPIAVPGIQPPFAFPVAAPPTPVAYFPGFSVNIAQNPHAFGPPSQPMGLVLGDISPDEQALLLNTQFPLPNGSNFGPTFGTWSTQVGTSTASEFYASPLPDHGVADQGMVMPASICSEPGGPFGFTSPAPAPIPQSAPSAPPPLVQPLSQPRQPVANSSGRIRAHIPPRLPTRSTPRPSPAAKTVQPRPTFTPIPHAGSPFPTDRPAMPLRTPAPNPRIPAQPHLQSPVAIRQTPATPRARSATPATAPTTPHARRSPAPALHATTGRALSSRPSHGYHPPANPAAVSTPAQVRSASPRPRSLAMNTPLGRSLQSQLRATRSLTPLSRLGTPIPTTPRPEIEHVLPPSTPIDGTPPARNDDMARASKPGHNEPVITFSGDVRHGVQPNDPPIFLGYGDPANLDEDRSDYSPQVSHVQTPPPLVGTVTQEDTDGSDGFPALDPVLEGAHKAWFESTVISAAPTSAEFAIAKTREALVLQNGRLSKGNPSAGRIKGAKKVSTYEDSDQKLMAMMRASMQISFTSGAPWMMPENVWFNEAKDFAKTHTKFPVDSLADEEFQKSLKLSASQIRGAPLDLVKRLVREAFNLEPGDLETVQWLQSGGRCFYPEYNMNPKDKFKTALVAKVVVVLYFGSTRRIGIFCLDELLKEDNPETVAQVLSMTALPDVFGGPQVLKITDPSPEASRGPPLAAIALAAIHIQHALERLKVLARTPDNKHKKKDEDGNMKKEFNESGYNEMWKGYVRDLAEHPDLGFLRSTFLDKLKQEYCRVVPRFERPIGSDHMW